MPPPLSNFQNMHHGKQRYIIRFKSLSGGGAGGCKCVCVCMGGVCVCVFQNYSGSLSLPIIYIFVKYTGIKTEIDIAITNT